MTYRQIKMNYDRGLWNKRMVAKAVEKGIITESEYFEITKESYDSGEEKANG